MSALALRSRRRGLASAGWDSIAAVQRSPDAAPSDTPAQPSARSSWTALTPGADHAARSAMRRSYYALTLPSAPRSVMGELEAESDDVVFWRRRSLSTRSASTTPTSGRPATRR
jgi:hypothetical protein